LGANFFRIRIFVGSTSEILPVVGVDALCLVMVEITGTPLGLEKIQVKVHIPRPDIFNQSSLDILDLVSKRAELLVLTPVDLFRILKTPLSFVFLFVVEPFYPIMRSFAVLLHGAAVRL
jgi:hypothetical protein